MHPDASLLSPEIGSRENDQLHQLHLQTDGFSQVIWVNCLSPQNTCFLEGNFQQQTLKVSRLNYIALV